MDTFSARCVLHPLAIVSVCESETRLRRGGNLLPTSAPLVGLLFGPVLNDGTVVIFDAVEAIYSFNPVVDTLPQLNLPKLAERKSLWCTIHPTYEMLGWYTVGSAIEEWHIKLHQEMTASLLMHADPVLLLMNASPDPCSRVLPLSVYRMQDTSRGSAASFLPLQVTLESNQAENVALDQIVKSVPTAGKNALETQNMRLAMSLKTLRAKIDFIIKGLAALQAEGKVDNTLLRMAGKIHAQLPEVTATLATAALEEEVLQCVMMVSVALAAKNTAQLNDLSDKYLSVFGRRGTHF